MHPSTARLLFVLAFVAACLAFWLGRRRVRPVGRAHTLREAWRLAFNLSLALMIGCGAAAAGGGCGGAGGGGSGGVVHPERLYGSGLGAEADAVWDTLMNEWARAAGFVPGDVTYEEATAAKTRADELLARLARLPGVEQGVPGLIALARLEFERRLDWQNFYVPEPPPEGATCYAPMPSRDMNADAYLRLEARVEALEQLADKGYMNEWLRAEVLPPLQEDLRLIREYGTDYEWWSQDGRTWELDPDRIRALLERVDAVLGRLAGPSR